jgi:drug/metabolite transporter (DMT)-like permease
MHKAPLSVYLKLVAVSAFWGGAFIAGRVVSQELPHFIAAAGRFIVACLILLPLAWRMEGGLPKLSRQQMVSTFALGVTGIFLYNYFFFAALERMPAGRTALFVALSPIVTALAVAALFHERLGKLKWLGIAIAFLGASIVITRGDVVGTFHDISVSIGAGELFMLGGVVSWVIYTIVGKFTLDGLSPLAATTYASCWGLFLLLIGAAFELPQLDVHKITWQVFAAILYLGVLGTVVSFVWYYEGVKAIGSSHTTVFTNLVPVFGVLFGGLILGERILISMIVGGLMVIAGVMLTNQFWKAK